MNTNNEFDELARRKLAERDFPFQEAHWLEAQQAIAAQGNTRKGGAWWYVAGGIAVIVAAWMLWPVNGPIAQHTGKAVVVSERNEGKSVAPQQVNEEVNEARMSNSTVENSEPLHTEVEPSVATAPVPKVAPTAIAKASNATPRVREVQSGSIPTTGPGVGISTDGSAVPTTHVAVAPTTPTGVHVDPEPSIAIAATTDPVDHTADAIDASLTPTAGEGADVTVQEPAVVTPAPTDNTDPSVKPEDASAKGDDIGSRSADDAIVAQPNLDPTPAASDPVIAADPITADNTTPQDSAATVVEPLLAPAPIIYPRAPWEIGVLGGIFNTPSTYTGGESATWSTDALTTAAFGAEWMHMGRNIGLGVGVHYGSFADRLHTPEVNRSTLTTNPFWYLSPIDTTILIVTGYDSTSNTYIGHNVNVTVNVLRLGLDSTITSVRVRDARQRINRTSYIEVPFLMDAHLVQGRWSFGVRGGPSIGLRTQRQGSVPSNEDEAYVEFDDVTTRSWVIGWSARAYVRYRFNAAWSVGIEPAVRGQFMDSFDQNSVTRRSMAFGGMISVSYRLP
ncbi:MAG: hypothetical protein IT226_01175 [Flavobacteriales bacterium]|nr:hypothetical protein [Flavobacteriales bacterium]